MSNLKLVDKTKANNEDKPGEHDLVNYLGQHMKFTFDHCPSHCCLGVINYTAKFDMELNGNDVIKDLQKQFPDHPAIPKTILLGSCHVQRTKKHPWTYLMSDAVLLKYRMNWVKRVFARVAKNHSAQKRLAATLEGGVDLDD